MSRSDGIRLTLATGASLFVGATSLMPSAAYSSWWWTALLAVAGAVVAAAIVRRRMWRRPAMFMLHGSLVMVLVGGCLTAYTSVRGTLHLSPGESSGVFVTDGGTPATLPAEIRLDTFETVYYPGMTIPRDFRSVVSVGGDTSRQIVISMNRIGRLDGYRLYQTSFDGCGGSIFTVVSDRAGTAVTYAGYLLFLLGGALWLLLPGLRRHRRHALCITVVAIASAAHAAPAVDAARADSLAWRQVVFQGRVVPFSTVATELTYKLTGSATVGPMKPEQFVASLIAYPSQWRQVEFIHVKDRRLRQALGLRGAYVSAAALYAPDGRYLPGEMYEGGAGPLDDAIMRLDERLALLASLWQGELFQPLAPGDSSLRSEASVTAEVAYNRVKPVRILFFISIAAALTALFAAWRRSLRPIIPAVAVTALWAVAVFGWLWHIVGHIPMSSAPEIMLAMSAGVALVALAVVCRHRSAMIAAAGMTMAGFFALVSWLSAKDPSMTPLMPVLASPWLAAHVSVVMMAYAILGFTLPVSLIGIASPRQRRGLVGLSESLLRPGVYLLGVGIILGAMWANVSWGRYWAWDPKETWALVTMLLYAIPLHRSMHLSDHPRLYHAYVALAFLSIVMTYAGVNLLPSLHSYQ